MTKIEPKNLPASVHQRLLNLARQRQRPFDELLRYYAIERFLYRLAQSPYQDRFILKGALIFTTWGAPQSRPTRDIDFLVYTLNTVENVVAIIQAIAQQAVTPDGFSFDPATVTGEVIKERAEYQGVRVHFAGQLGQARIPLQIDLAFSDIVSPGPQMVSYPSLLGYPSPRLRGYPREAVVAEKFHALVTLGMVNSRMKDFYDLWLLASQFEFEGLILTVAIRETFARRATDLPAEIPAALGADFVQAKQGQWQAFLATAQLTQAPASLGDVLADIRQFVWPASEALRAETPFTGRWPAGGPWQPPAG
ncbi:MAG: nucleotidyl transferase AbiEii/AbiGii toxin family protein [Anaerolineales bacterium]|nr:nucleotidyl transferase AbiEii/AbiGii toxin family protein [Anaerolineales bacterium]